MNTSVEIIQEEILNKVYLIRGKKVMFDFDLAELYEVKTKRLKESVRRNINRFPDDFMFELTENEFESLRTQFASSKRGGIRYMPFAFTEQGLAMLSSVLNSEKAIQVNIQIMRIFSKIRQALYDYTELRMMVEEIKRKGDNNSKNIELVFQYLDELLEKKKKKSRNEIGYKIPKKRKNT